MFYIFLEYRTLDKMQKAINSVIHHGQGTLESSEPDWRMRVIHLHGLQSFTELRVAIEVPTSL
jgi:hypothetical protein